jgi:hypothetical protein
VQLTVRSDSVASLTWHVPRQPLLQLRAIEKLPVRRTADGVIVQKRVLVWQALEPGTVSMKTLAIESRRSKLCFPEISITVRDPGP